MHVFIIMAIYKRQKSKTYLKTISHCYDAVSKTFTAVYDVDRARI